MERQPLSDRSNIPHNGVARSEFDYSTPANEKKASRQVVKKVPRNSVSSINLTISDIMMITTVCSGST